MTSLKNLCVPPFFLWVYVNIGVPKNMVEKIHSAFQIAPKLGVKIPMFGQTNYTLGIGHIDNLAG